MRLDADEVATISDGTYRSVTSTQSRREQFQNLSNPALVSRDTKCQIGMCGEAFGAAVGSDHGAETVGVGVLRVVV